MSKKCDLCQKVFEFPYLLERHKNRKKPCNIINNKFDCKLCNISFDHKSRLDTHNNSKKHINNYNIQIANTINNNNTNVFNNTIHNHITIVRGFSETNINVINLSDLEKLLAYNNKLDYYINMFNSDPDDIYYDSVFIEHVFKLFINIFEIFFKLYDMLVF